MDGAERMSLLQKEREYTTAMTTMRGKGVSEDAPALRAIQMSLLRTRERLECRDARPIRLTTANAEPPKPGPSKKAATAPQTSLFLQVQVPYATDRLPDPKYSAAATRDVMRYYSGVLDPDFRDFAFGTVSVTIPTARGRGEFPVPGGWLFVDKPDPAKHFLVREIVPGDRKSFCGYLSAPAQENDLLVFVHGYRVTFAEAALRTAQLAHDLEFRGKTMFYSWPSAGKADGYWQDEDSCRISVLRFEKLLAELLTAKVRKVYIVAHSMGSRIVIPALSRLAQERKDVSKIAEVIVAAPDFNVIEFKQVSERFAQLRSKGTRMTLYASSNDAALRVSRGIHSYQRLGESGPRLSTFAGVDSIDASATTPLTRAFGHSYVSDSPRVITDIQQIVLHRSEPQQRGLTEVPSASLKGWRF